MVADTLSHVSGLVSYLSRITRDSNATAACRLLKSIVLASSRDELHAYQLEFLQNGSFLFHLNRALKGGNVGFSQEMVMITVTDSMDGTRTLSRIFPLPLVKRLEIAGRFTPLTDMNYHEPLRESDSDSDVIDNMAMVTVFSPPQKNWAGFWASLDLERNDYSFIWNQEMKQRLSNTLEQELTNFDTRLSTDSSAVWDFEGFRVNYPNLEHFICVDGYYLQQLLDFIHDKDTVEIMNAPKFIRHVCDLFIVTRNLADRRILLYLMLRVLQIDKQATKNFPVMRYLCFLLEDRAIDPLMESLILQIFECVCCYQRITEQFQDYHGVNIIASMFAQFVTQTARGERVILPESEGTSSLQCDLPKLDEMARCCTVLSVILHSCESMVRIREEYLMEPILSQLLRVFLLLTDRSLHHTMLAILNTALSTSLQAQTTIYCSGFFRVLLLTSCGEEGMCVETAQLLHQYHMVQEQTDLQNTFQDVNEKHLDVPNCMKNAENEDERVELARKYSFLRFFLPSSLIALLERRGPEAFCSVFNSDETETSEVIWGAREREHMKTCIEEQLREYKESILADHRNVWTYKAPQPINYENIENKLYICNVFLEAFLKPDCEVPPTVDAVKFFEELIHELQLRWSAVLRMKGEMDPLTFSDIQLILQSLLKVLRTKKEVSTVDKKAFEVLGQCLDVDLDSSSNQQIANEVLDIIEEALQPASFGKPTMVNVYSCADSGILERFDSVISYYLPDSLPSAEEKDSVLSQILQKTLQCLSIISSNGDSRVIDAFVTFPTIIHVLTSFIDPSYMEKNADLCIIVLNIFIVFLHNEKLLEICVNAGCIIFLLQVAICFVERIEKDREVITLTETCLQLFAGIGNNITPPKVITDALTQLVTPGLMKALRRNQFITLIRRDNIREPLLIWNRSMQETLLNVLEKEEDAIVNSDDPSADWNAQSFCHREGYRHIYTNLANEFIVDDVFLDPFLANPNVQLTDPTSDHFLKALIAKVIQLQKMREPGFADKSSEETLMHFLQVTLCSLQKLLEVSPDLLVVFINDPSVHNVFALLTDTTIPWDILQLLLQILKLALTTPTACMILASFVPNLRILLQFDSTDCESLVLDVLDQFITNNDDVVQLIMRSSLILILLDMALFYEKEYDGFIQDKAIQLLGKMMKSFKYGESVQKYMIALFTPLFRGENEKQSILLNCDEDPMSFIEVINSEIHAPNVYWDSEVKEDLFTFLRSEVRSMRTTETEYVFDDKEVSKRMRNMRVTLNKQLVVADIFIREYVENPFCELDATAFLTGLIDALKQRLPGVAKNDRKDIEDYSMLLKALKNNIQSRNDPLDPALTTLVVSFLIDVIRSNVSAAQDTALSTLESISQTPFGMFEFERNDKAIEEQSYIVDLLAASVILGKRNGSCFQVTEILKSIVTQNDRLRDTCYHAGVLFYAFHSVLSNIDEIESPRCTARVYLDILKKFVTVPEIEKDVLFFTTSNFKGIFQKEASIVNLFIRKPHEAFESDNLVRKWIPESREALREATEAEIARLNADTASSAGWDRVTNRFNLTGVEEMWKKYTKTSTNNLRRSPQESTAIKPRQTAFVPHSNLPPPDSLPPRSDSIIWCVCYKQSSTSISV